MSTTASAVTTVHLKDICKIASGMPSPRAKAEDADGKELMSVTFPSIQPGYLDQAAFQPILASDRAFESLAVPGTILLKSVSPFAATLVPEGMGDLFVGSNVITLSVLPDAPVTANYLVAYLNSELGALNLEKVQAGASGVLRMLRTSQIRSLPVPIPSAQQQQQLADLFSYTAEMSHRLKQLRSLEWSRYNTVFSDVVE